MMGMTFRRTMDHPYPAALCPGPFRGEFSAQLAGTEVLQTENASDWNDLDMWCWFGEEGVLMCRSAGVVCTRPAYSLGYNRREMFNDYYYYGVLLASFSLDSALQLCINTGPASATLAQCWYTVGGRGYARYTCTLPVCARPLSLSLAPEINRHLGRLAGLPAELRTRSARLPQLRHPYRRRPGDNSLDTEQSTGSRRNRAVLLSATAASPRLLLLLLLL